MGGRRTEVQVQVQGSSWLRHVQRVWPFSGGTGLLPPALRFTCASFALDAAFARPSGNPTSSGRTCQQCQHQQGTSITTVYPRRRLRPSTPHLTSWACAVTKAHKTTTHNTKRIRSILTHCGMTSTSTRTSEGQLGKKSGKAACGGAEMAGETAHDA